MRSQLSSWLSIDLYSVAMLSSVMHHRSRRARHQQFVEIQMVRSEFAAIVAGGDADDPREASGADAGDRCLFDGVEIEAVDDDLVHAAGGRRQRRRDGTAQRGAVGVVGARLEL